MVRRPYTWYGVHAQALLRKLCTGEVAAALARGGSSSSCSSSSAAGAMAAAAHLPGAAVAQQQRLPSFVGKSGIGGSSLPSRLLSNQAAPGQQRPPTIPPTTHRASRLAAAGDSAAGSMTGEGQSIAGSLPSFWKVRQEAFNAIPAVPKLLGFAGGCRYGVNRGWVWKRAELLEGPTGGVQRHPHGAKLLECVGACGHCGGVGTFVGVNMVVGVGMVAGCIPRWV
eukprot:361515-Chlamydomonas_euryale.AAC.3